MLTALLFNFEFELPSHDGLFDAQAYPQGNKVSGDVRIDDHAAKRIEALFARVGRMLNYSQASATRTAMPASAHTSPSAGEAQASQAVQDQAWDVVLPFL